MLPRTFFMSKKILTFLLLLQSFHGVYP
jgi:hypothetical protein